MKILGDVAKYKWIILLVIISFLTNLLGIKWGLPNHKRTNLVLDEKLRTEQFYALLAKTRDEIYIRAGENTAAYAWRMKKKGEIYDEMVNIQTPIKRDGTIVLKSDRTIPKEILRALNSYLLHSTHPDERLILTSLARMQPEKLDLDPHFYQYGTSYIYFLGSWFWLASKIGYLKLTKDLTFYHTHPEEMAKFYFLGRIISVFCATFCVLLIYLIANNLYKNKKVALLNALFLAIIPITFIEANGMKPHVYAAFWSLLSVYFITKIYISNKKKYYLYAGIALGIAAGATIYSWIYLLFLPIILFFSDVTNENWTSRLLTIIKRTIYVFTVSLLVFIITNPYTLISFQAYRDEFRWAASHHHFVLTPWVFLYLPLREGIGTFLWLILFVTIVYSALKRERSDTILLSFLLPLVIFIAFASGGLGASAEYIRYHLPLVSMLLIIPSRSIVDIYSKTARFGKFAIILLCGAGIIYTASLRLSYIIWFARDNETQAESIKAGQWINENIPKDSSIGIIKYTPHADCTPPFRFTNYKIISSFERVKNISEVEKLPEYFVIGETIGMVTTKKFTPWEDFSDYYQIIKYFKHEIKLGPFTFSNKFSSANYPVAIYKLK